jgi:hypothetical protein
MEPRGRQPDRELRRHQPMGPGGGERDLSRDLPVSIASGPGPDRGAGAAPQQGAPDQPPPRRELRRQDGFPRDGHHRAALAKGRRPSGQVDRRPHGVPGGRQRSGLGPALRGLAGAEEGRDRDRPQGQAAGRPRGHGGGLRLPRSGEAAPTGEWARRPTTSCWSR